MFSRTSKTITSGLGHQVRLASSSSSPPLRRAFTPRSSTRTTPIATTTPTTENVKATERVTPSQVVGSSTIATTPQSVAPTSTSPSAISPDATSLPSNESFESYPTTLPSPSVTATEIDWSTSFHGLSSTPFSSSQATTLMKPLQSSEIEIKPDGLLYLPEILYRRILNKAFGPGGWGMVPRGEMTVLKGMVTREWGLVAGGR